MGAGCLFPVVALLLSASPGILNAGIWTALLWMPPGFGLLVGGSVLAATSWSHVRGAEVVVTDRRVITKDGLYSTSAADLRLSQVESVAVHQGIIGRCFGFGSLAVTGTGGARLAVVGVVAPMDFRQRVLEAAERPAHR